MKEWTESTFELIVTPNGHNNILGDEITQENANSILSYLFAVIIKNTEQYWPTQNKTLTKTTTKLIRALQKFKKQLIHFFLRKWGY